MFGVQLKCLCTLLRASEITKTKPKAEPLQHPPVLAIFRQTVCRGLEREMSRKNLAGNWMGESRRVTLRLTNADIRLLNHLAETWQSDRSEVLRCALREADVHEHRRSRDALIAELPTMTGPRLRALVGRHWIRGRSKMTKAHLLQAL